MKTTITAMIIALFMIGMTAADISNEVDTSSLLASMTTQEYVDHYGMMYLNGDRSQETIGTLNIYAEKYNVYPTMDIFATVEPVVETVEPVVETVTVESVVGTVLTETVVEPISVPRTIPDNQNQYLFIGAMMMMFVLYLAFLRD